MGITNDNFSDKVRRLIKNHCPRTARHKCLVAAQEIYGTEGNEWKEAYARMLEEYGLLNVDKKH